MLLDNECLFCDNQEITSGTSYSNNVVRFGEGDVSYVPMIAQVTEDFLGLTDLKIKIQTSSEPTFESAVDLVEATMALADLKAGARFPFSYLPKGNLGYMRLALIATGVATQGKITAGVTAGVDSDR